MKLYRTKQGPVVVDEGNSYLLEEVSWDDLLSRDNLYSDVRVRIGKKTCSAAQHPTAPLAPVDGQEVWAAGVTYLRSREARKEESKSAGGGDFYDRVYAAERPELFFKSSGSRVVGSGEKVRTRRDSKWNVPEPELTLLLSPTGQINGYTIGDDVSSRDIEGENPLYLPQAKSYDGACAIGPCIYLTDQPLPRETKISITVHRDGETAFAGETDIGQIKRDLRSLAEYLFRENSHPRGCFLMTGTGVVPPDSFTLMPADKISITIEPIGTLVNVVA